MAVLGVTIITPTLPEIQDYFGATSGQIGLLITFFTLPGVVLTPTLGVAPDRYGCKKVLAPALIIFGLADGTCALTRDGFDLLLALRSVQGMGLRLWAR